MDIFVSPILRLSWNLGIASPASLLTTILVSIQHFSLSCFNVAFVSLFSFFLCRPLYVNYRPVSASVSVSINLTACLYVCFLLSSFTIFQLNSLSCDSNDSNKRYGVFFIRLYSACFHNTQLQRNLVVGYSRSPESTVNTLLPQFVSVDINT